ncbi:MAG: peptidase S1 [Bacteroidetes bacterium]|nr:peptidase S1 [Bacteroidota bacterium]
MNTRLLATAALGSSALLLSACSGLMNRAPVGGSSTNSTSSNGMPDWRATPIFGTVNLRAGFTPDPTTRTVAAGGSSRNPVSGEGCEGYLNLGAPDLDLNYTAGSLPLTISAASNSDISMVIYTPDRRWICDDDSGGDLNPSVTFENPQSGNYNIWIATYNATSDRPSSTVGFSELRRNVHE